MPYPDGCCLPMAQQLYSVCETHGTDCPDTVVRKTTVHPSGERWLLAAENASYDFEFCPWCGTRFQEADGLGTGTRRLRIIE